MESSRRLLLFLAALVLGAGALAVYWAWPWDEGQGAGAQSIVNIQMGDRWFCNPSADGDTTGTVCTVTVATGSLVTWTNTSDTPHTATHCADNFGACSGPRVWDTGFLSNLGQVSLPQGPFLTPGKLIYRCQAHPDEMRATLIVQEAGPGPTQTPTATAAPTVTPPPATPTATPVSTPKPSPKPTPTSSSFRSGDVNCDGRIDALDALAVLLHAAQLEPAADCLTVAGDVNCDRKVSSGDSLLILRHMAGLKVTQPPKCRPIGAIIPSAP